jgi:hypothetical protein
VERVDLLEQVDVVDPALRGLAAKSGVKARA